MQLYVRASSSLKPATWEVAIRCEERETTVVLDDPFQEEQHDQLRWYLEEHYANSPFQVERATRTRQRLHEYGLSLIRMLDLPGFFQGMEVPLPSLRIFVECSADDAAFNRILWETLEHPECHSAIAQELVVTRSVCCQIEGTPQAPPRVDGCFRILLIAARNLAKREEPDHRLISRSLVRTIASVSRFRTVELELVRPGTFSALKDSLQSHGGGYYDLVHFDVHGDMALSEGKKL
jgi:hypothetical protein